MAQLYPISCCSLKTCKYSQTAINLIDIIGDLWLLFSLFANIVLSKTRHHANVGRSLPAGGHSCLSTLQLHYHPKLNCCCLFLSRSANRKRFLWSPSQGSCGEFSPDEASYKHSCPSEYRSCLLARWPCFSHVRVNILPKMFLSGAVLKASPL